MLGHCVSTRESCAAPAHGHPPASCAACVCGEYFTSLGRRVRVHGYSAKTYREAMGLGKTTPLVTAGFSQAMRDRQRRRYQDTTACRADLAEGHELARRGELNRLARASLENLSIETRNTRDTALAVGRRARS